MEDSCPQRHAQNAVASGKLRGRELHHRDSFREQKAESATAKLRQQAEKSKKRASALTRRPFFRLERAKQQAPSNFAAANRVLSIDFCSLGGFNAEAPFSYAFVTRGFIVTSKTTKPYAEENLLTALDLRQSSREQPQHKHLETPKTRPSERGQAPYALQRTSEPSIGAENSRQTSGAVPLPPSTKVSISQKLKIHSPQTTRMLHTRHMEAVLSDISALAYWRSHSESSGDISADCRMEPKTRSLPSIDAPTKTAADDIANWGLADREDIHLLVSSRESCRAIKGVTCTVCTSELPRNSLARTLGQVYVVGPELLFVQLAQRLSLAALLAVGHELCGTYRLGVEPKDAPIYDVQPLTSVSELKSYAQRARGIRGRPKALQAIQWLADGSASPAETALSIMFRLPYRHGGYCLGKPLLNHEIALDPTAERLFGRSSIRPDFYWPEAKHPAEYDGALYHSSREQAEYDERRRNAYAAMGMNVTVFATRHLYNLDLLDEMAQAVRKNISLRRRELPIDYPIRHNALFEETCAYWIDLKDGTASNEEIAWGAARYAAPNMPW